MRTGVQTLCPHKSRCAYALPRHVITIRTIEALTLLLASQSVCLALAAISTYGSGITGWTNTLTRLRIAASTILTTAIRATLLAVLTLWTPLSAQRSSEARCAVTFPGNRIAFAPVLTLANLGTVLPETIGRTLVFALVAPVALLTSAASILGVTGRVVLAQAQLVAVGSPTVWWTIYITDLSSVSFVALASIRSNAHSMFASIAACRHAPIAFLILLIPSATLLQNAFLGYT